MIISAIVATAENQVIGKDGQMPWHLPTDLKWFKKHTLGHHIIMGRKNYDSIGMALPKRQNLVISRNTDLQIPGCTVFQNIQAAIDHAFLNGESECFIIGGQQIYAQTHDQWQKLYLTQVHARPDGDVFFPAIDLDKWQTIYSKTHMADDKNPLSFTFKILVR